jgi:hypothetical protein
MDDSGREWIRLLLWAFPEEQGAEASVFAVDRRLRLLNLATYIALLNSRLQKDQDNSSKR